MRSYTLLFALCISFLAKAQPPLPDALRVSAYIGDRLSEKGHPRVLANDQGQTIVVREDTRNEVNELFAQGVDCQQKPGRVKDQSFPG